MGLEHEYEASMDDTSYPYYHGSRVPNYDRRGRVTSLNSGARAPYETRRGFGSSSHDLTPPQREPTDLRRTRRQPLPAIGRTALPETRNTLDHDLVDEEVGEIARQSSRFIPTDVTPSAGILPQKTIFQSSQSDLQSHKRRQKATVKFNNKNQRFEPMTRRVTAGVHQLPPIRQSGTRQWPVTIPNHMAMFYDSDDQYSELLERPDAPEPNTTPPLVHSHDGNLNCADSLDTEPIDYIDED